MEVVKTAEKGARQADHATVLFRFPVQLFRKTNFSEESVKDPVNFLNYNSLASSRKIVT